LGRRGPGTGLRQAQTVAEARQWLRLFDSLASPRAHTMLPHLGLRLSDAAPLCEVGTRAAASLRSVLAQTETPAMLDDVNGVLAAAYAETMQRFGARLARGVFALTAEGFPDAEQAAALARWDEALRGLRDGRDDRVLPPGKRVITVALVGHYFALVEPIDRTAAATGMDWLGALARRRRFASLCRAVGRVLSPGEWQRFAALAGDADGAILPLRD
jgi:hypothetical protein